MMRRLTAFILAGAMLLSLQGCAWFAPKEMPLDRISLGAFSQGTQQVPTEGGGSAQLPRLALKVGETVEVPLSLPEVRDLSVAVSCGDPGAVSAQIDSQGVLRVEGLAQTGGAVVELVFSAPWHRDGVFQFAAAVELRPMDLEVLPPPGEESLPDPLVLTAGETLSLPLSLPDGVEAVLDPLPDGGPLEAGLQGATLTLRALSPGETVLTLRAGPTSVYAPAQVQLSVAVKPRPSPDGPPPVLTLEQEANRSVDQSAYEDLIQEIIALTNREREARSLPPLTRLTGVEVCAALRAQEAARLWDHTRPDGRGFSTIFEDCGLAYSHMGENLHTANHFRSAQEVVDAFMASETHRENLLRASFSGIGIGVYHEANDWYYCQLFVGL